MLIAENILLALTGLKSNKMRAFLTMLGIIIGIASVIAIMTVGNSLNTSVASSMHEMGADNLTVGLKKKSNGGEVTAEGMRFGAGNRRAMTEQDYITDEMLDAFKDAYGEKIDTLSISESAGSGTAEDGQLSANVSMTGVNEGYLEINKLTLLAGRSLTERDQKEGRKVAVVSDKLVDKLFGGDYDAALENTVDINIGNRYYGYTIVGIYKYDEDAVFMSESEEDIVTEVYLPLKAAKNQNHSEEGYTQFTVVTAAGTDNNSFMEDIKYFFNVYYARNENYEVNVTSMKDMMEEMTKMLSTISIAISIIAGISLLVGGIGVMNIMLVSITERTREIGTRKALGASNGSIRLQFISEAIVICLTGGFIGIVLGLLLGTAAASLLGYEAAASMGSIVFSVGFSVLMGVFFGYYPANKAAKMSPIEALRYE